MHSIGLSFFTYSSVGNSYIHYETNMYKGIPQCGYRVCMADTLPCDGAFNYTLIMPCRHMMVPVGTAGYVNVHHHDNHFFPRL